VRLIPDQDSTEAPSKVVARQLRKARVTLAVGEQTATQAKGRTSPDLGDLSPDARNAANSDAIA